MPKVKPVKYSRKALSEIRAFVFGIAQKGYPETSIKFTNKLYDFGDTLGLMPEKYTLCRTLIWNLRNWRCAALDSNYIFAYKVFTTHITIMRVVHASRIR